MSSQWAVPIIVIVLALGIVSVYAGTLTGTQVSTGASGTTFRATWAQGCTDIQAGLNMCDPDRPDGVSVFCQSSSVGTTASSNKAYKCGGSGTICSCDNLGSNNFECFLTGVQPSEGCQRCDSACDDPNYCDTEYDCVEPSSGLCSGSAECVCNDDRCDDQYCVGNSLVSKSCSADGTACVESAPVSCGSNTPYVCDIGSNECGSGTWTRTERGCSGDRCFSREDFGASCSIGCDPGETCESGSCVECICEATFADCEDTCSYVGCEQDCEEQWVQCLYNHPC